EQRPELEAQAWSQKFCLVACLALESDWVVILQPFQAEPLAHESDLGRAYRPERPPQHVEREDNKSVNHQIDRVTSYHIQEPVHLSPPSSLWSHCRACSSDVQYVVALSPDCEPWKLQYNAHSGIGCPDLARLTAPLRLPPYVARAILRTEAARTRPMNNKRFEKIHPVILSGGAGSRLWPLSRRLLPKQLLPLTGARTMIQETALRFAGAPFANCTIICNEEHRFLIAEQLREAGVKDSTIVLEPVGRNT